MTELLMMEAALFQLGTALRNEPSDSIQMAATIFARALDDAKAGGINAARVNDLEFALNDLVAAVDDAGAPMDVVKIVAMLQNDVARLRATASVPPETVAMIRALQEKLRTRRTAIERNTYRAEGSPEAELPYPPAELCGAAIPLREMLYSAGFETPSLDAFIDEPDSVRYHSLGELIDELDVIATGS
ncbi:MAG: hypothetical protein WA208_10560 [Thermoanaerobaculia bacterium]